MNNSPTATRVLFNSNELSELWPRVSNLFPYLRTETKDTLCHYWNSNEIFMEILWIVATLLSRYSENYVMSNLKTCLYRSYKIICYSTSLTFIWLRVGKTTHTPSPFVRNFRLRILDIALSYLNSIILCVYSFTLQLSVEGSTRR